MKYNKAGIDFENCYVCGTKLKEVTHKRNIQRRCKSCIYHGVGEVKPVVEEGDEDDWSVLDDPKAVNEKDYGRVFREPTQLYTGHSSLSELVGGSSNYNHIHGPSRDGVRYSNRKKDKKHE
ncbi:hypothetical protein N9W20_00275 [Candidatus Pelagibacter bacterium]|nr:hypothetical protein [Candidatus Pelagibacter bacterium]